jgi:hypothetical protein
VRVANTSSYCNVSSLFSQRVARWKLTGKMIFLQNTLGITGCMLRYLRFLLSVPGQPHNPRKSTHGQTQSGTYRQSPEPRSNQLENTRSISITHDWGHYKINSKANRKGHRKPPRSSPDCVNLSRGAIRTTVQKKETRGITEGRARSSRTYAGKLTRRATSA